MSREKTAEFLADCLAQMPPQRGEVKVIVDTAIYGLKMIAQGGEWSESEALAAWASNRSTWAADEAEWAAYWAAHWAAYWVASCVASFSAQDRVAKWAADWAARAHQDRAAERARQARVREKLGLNTKGA